MSREATRWYGEVVVVHSDVWARGLAEELAVVPEQVQLKSPRSVQDSTLSLLRLGSKIARRIDSQLT